MSHYAEVHAQLDPEQLTEFPNGIRLQEIELVLTDDPERPAGARFSPSSARSTLAGRASWRSSC